MAEDPAVDSIEVDCLERVDMSLPATPDLDEAVARRLTVHDGAPWGIDRIDTNGEHPKLSLLLAPSASVRAYCDRPTLAPCTGNPIDGKYDDGDLGGQGVRVYVVDSGIQDSNVDFGGRVVNGHTVRAAPVAACKGSSRPCYAYSAILPAYQHPTHTTRPSITHTPPPQPLSLSFTPRSPSSATSAPRAKRSTASSPPTALDAAGTAPTWPRPSAASTTASQRK